MFYSFNTPTSENEIEYREKLYKLLFCQPAWKAYIFTFILHAFLIWGVICECYKSIQSTTAVKAALDMKN